MLLIYVDQNKLIVECKTGNISFDKTVENFHDSCTVS